MLLAFRVARGFAWAGALALGCGCQSAAQPNNFGVAPPAAWRPAPPDAYTVPGTPLAAWKGPEGSSLVVYRSLPIPQATAAGMAEEMANRLANLPDLKVVVRRTETWGGQEGARVEAIAPGTGDALAATGTGTPIAPEGRDLVPTHRVELGFPRSGDTLWICWHYPASAEGELAPQVESTLRTLRIGSTTEAVSTY